jgi:hypothetical protein
MQARAARCSAARGAAEYRRRALEQFAPLPLHQYLALGRRIRVAQADSHQKSIELRFRQAVGTDLLVRILCRDDKERLGQRMGDPIDADLTLLHGLEQRALRLGTGAIDLIGQQQLGENRSTPKLKFVGTCDRIWTRR